MGREKEVAIIRAMRRDAEIRNCIARWRSVSLRVTTMLGHKFSKGVSWQGSAKGSIIKSIGSVRPMGYTVDWPRFREAMDRAVKIEERHTKEATEEIEAMAEEVAESLPQE